MTISELFPADFDTEMANTRNMLVLAPGPKSLWKSHDKSMQFGYLAWHTAELVNWALETVRCDAHHPPRRATGRVSASQWDRDSWNVRAGGGRAHGNHPGPILEDLSQPEPSFERNSRSCEPHRHSAETILTHNVNGG